MNKTFFFFGFLFTLILLASQTFAATYTVDQVLSDDYSVTEYLQEDADNFVYSVAEENYPYIEVELQAYGGFEPRFYVYDVDEDRFLFQESANLNEKITYAFTPEASEEGGIKEYYFIILVGDGGGSFDFNYDVTRQNDAGLGGDVTKRFSDAQTIPAGEYTGMLGGGDTKDFFAYDIAQDETITITLQSKDEERLGLELIESNLVTTIDERTPTEGIERTFTSSQDQKVWIGIEGTTHYALSIASDYEEEEEEEAQGMATPPMPPMPPLPDDFKDDTTTNEEEQEEGLSTQMMIIILLLLVGLILVVGLIFYEKYHKKKKAAEKK